MLNSQAPDFEGARFVPLDDLTGYSVLTVESTPLLYAPGEGERRNQFFIGVLLYDAPGQVVGAGGRWMNPARYLATHLEQVIQERLPSSPRMYGGFESTRRWSVRIYGLDGREIGHVRESRNERTAHTEPFAGPFEGYSVRVAATASAPVVWTGRFVAVEITFIGLMALRALANF